MSTAATYDSTSEGSGKVSEEFYPCKTILIVDDSAEALQLQKIILQSTGARIVAVKTIREAVRFLQIAQPDLVLTDLHFPDRNSGFGLLSFIGKKPHLCAVPTLVVSGKSDHKSIEDAYFLGAVEYLVKPFIPQDLLRKVSSYL